MKLYAFDGVSPKLELLPVAARRALDSVGLKVSLVAWQALDRSVRERIVRAGSAPDVDEGAVTAAAAEARPPAVRIEPVPEPASHEVPPELREALGPERPLPDASWSALSPLGRYALLKVARRGNPTRIDAAYREIVGQSAASSHLAPEGGVRMVSVSAKAPTLRRALAESWVHLSAEAFARLQGADAPKGDVLATARLAGICGAKRTADLIPLCHPLSLTHAGVSFELQENLGRVRILAEVEVIDRTGVEMEAMLAATTAALTIYDMLKSVDRGMSVGPTRLLEKSGGRSGHFRQDEAEQGAEKS